MRSLHVEFGEITKSLLNTVRIKINLFEYKEESEIVVRSLSSNPQINSFSNIIRRLYSRNGSKNENSKYGDKYDTNMDDLSTVEIVSRLE